MVQLGRHTLHLRSRYRFVQRALNLGVSFEISVPDSTDFFVVIFIRGVWRSPTTFPTLREEQAVFGSVCRVASTQRSATDPAVDRVAQLIIDYCRLVEKYPRLTFPEFMELWLEADAIANGFYEAKPENADN